MNIKKIITVGIAGVAMGIMALNGAEVSNVKARQRYPWNGKVDIDCTLTGTAGMKYALTVNARDKIGGTNLTVKAVTVEGDTATGNPVSVTSGVYRLVWDADADLPNGYRCEKLSISVSVADNSKKFMIVDLTSGAITYQASPPEGGWDVDEYKGTKMAFVRIEPGMFTQYSMEGMPGREVTITKPYYIGVLPVTHKQLRTLSGPSYMATSRFSYAYDDNTSYFTVYYEYRNDGYNPGDNYRATLAYRGGSDASGRSNLWPLKGRSVDLNSPIGVLRSRSGCEYFDLPTEAQITFARSEIIWSGYDLCQDCYTDWFGNANVVDPQGEVPQYSTTPPYPTVKSACVSSSGRAQVENKTVGTRFCFSDVD